MNLKKLHNLCTLVYRTVASGNCNVSEEECIKLLEELFQNPDGSNTKAFSSDDLEKLSDGLIDLTTRADALKKEEVNEKVRQNVIQEMFDRKLKTIRYKH